MNDTFGAAATRLFGATAALLGWRANEFWESTPAELVAALGPPDGRETLGRDAIAHLRSLLPDDEDQ